MIPILADSVERLARTIEKKDRYTGGHARRVAYYSGLLCKHLGLDAARTERIRLGALLHDFGKIEIDDRILKKDAPLDPDEWRVMMRHPDLGDRLMRRYGGVEEVIDGVRYHHERWDGRGYPYGLQGEAIPLIARIVAVADTYDSIVSTRPYRRGRPPSVAFEEIVSQSGAQFDPAVVQAFISAFATEKMGQRHRDSSSIPCVNPDL